jgi:serine/threonine protein kinase
MDHLAEDDLVDLARGQRPLGELPAVEGHLADCAACSSLLATLINAPRDDDGARRDLAGKTLGPYRLEALIGAGAMGEVYSAWDLRLHRRVALKALSARFAETPERIRRLEAEGRAAAAISHPSVVTIFDSGSEGGVP